MSLYGDLYREHQMQDGPDDDDPPVMCKCGHADYCHDDVGPLYEPVGACLAPLCDCDELKAVTAWED
jgi:hypothetical protein